MRRILSTLGVIAVAGAVFASTAASEEESHTYKLEMFNAFGLVEGSEVKIAGVNAGTVESLDISENKTALVEVKLTGPLSVLGADTECSSEPQSLIAEYFIVCQPKGEKLDDGEILPNKVKQTVQNDLVLNTLRLPFRQRLALLINEFGTALAGNPENLNEAIRLGAPALDDLDEALRILARQNTVIRDLNVDSDKIVGTLADRREDVTAFIREAGNAAGASAERRDDLSQNFDILDDFLTELTPTMAALEDSAIQTTPLLTDLRAAAPQLNELAVSLPAFNRAGERSLVTLGQASVTGRRALNRGVQNGTFEALADAGIQAPRTTELIADFLEDLDDPRRAVEADDRAEKSCEDETASCFSTGREGPTGYTGLEGLLNYAYYQAGALNQYDSIGHVLHFSLYDVFAGPCGNYNAAQDYPANGGGRTTDLLQAEECVGGLGPNQPGISPGQSEDDLGIPPYDPAACPDGASPGADPRATSLCPGAGPRRARSDENTEEPPLVQPPDSDPTDEGGGDGGSDSPIPGLPDLPVAPGSGSGLGDILNLPNNQLGLRDRRERGRGGGMGRATEDLLDFLFAP